jgi:AcrR family transcriptional regulator
MQARAQASAETGQKILDAAEAVFDEGSLEEVTLATVAKRAGVTVQTIMRRFGSKEGLLAATYAHAAAKMGSSREAAPLGDPGGAIRGLVDHYERYGDRILRLLAEEARYPAFRVVTDIGRSYHEDWCKRAFHSALAGLSGIERKRRVAQFIAVTDIYVWKLLRRDRSLSKQQTTIAMQELLKPLMERNR